LQSLRQSGVEPPHSKAYGTFTQHFCATVQPVTFTAIVPPGQEAMQVPPSVEHRAVGGGGQSLRQVQWFSHSSQTWLPHGVQRNVPSTMHLQEKSAAFTSHQATGLRSGQQG
jgi:hypothetical protein